MEFSENKNIYLQIADLICEKILIGKWKEESRIPSVREIAVELEVNPNTAIRAYNYLQDKEIIYNKRGIGYFVSPDGYQKTLLLQKDEFIKNELVIIFKKMNLLKMSMNQIQELYNKIQLEK